MQPPEGTETALQRQLGGCLLQRKIISQALNHIHFAVEDFETDWLGLVDADIHEGAICEVLIGWDRFQSSS